jgi:hypothetical protein
VIFRRAAGEVGPTFSHCIEPELVFQGKDYFDELLERIREIRASERRFYQKITDLYALSLDYSAEALLWCS